MAKIGYQGIEGSNSEEAAHQMAKKLGLQQVEFIPLVSSAVVISNLKDCQIDYGVIAIKNSIGGVVKESFDAIKDECFELVATRILPIHHCLFKKDETVGESTLTTVASHIQALTQTKTFRSRQYPQLQSLEIEDTALGARQLYEGKLPASTAVICRKNAGERYGLHLIGENIEDDRNNRTEFRMIRIPKIDYENKEKPTLRERILYECVNEKGLGYISKAVFIAVILFCINLPRWFNWSAWETATTVGGAITVIFLYLTSNKVRKKVRYSTLTGYWKYYSIPESKSSKRIDQRYETPRVVEIKEVNGELEFKGWICDNTNRPLFVSIHSLVSPLGTDSGLMYHYGPPKELHREVHLQGLVYLNWDTRNHAAKINRMSGWYSGHVTLETGRVEYLRISAEEYQVLKDSQFL